MKLRTKSILLLVICFIFIIMAPVLADTTTPGEDDETKTTTPTAKDNSLADAINKAFGSSVTGQDIADMRVNNQMGYGEIGMAFGMANASGKTTEEILAMRQQDMGWGDIAKSLGLKVSDLMSRNSSVLRNAKMNKEDKAFKNEMNKENNKGAGNNGDKGNSGGKGSGNGGNSGGGSKGK